MSWFLWQCEFYDDLSECPYTDERVYRTREEAEKRAERMTFTDDGIDYWATVSPVRACWKEET